MARLPHVCYPVPQDRRVFVFQRLSLLNVLCQAPGRGSFLQSLQYYIVLSSCVVGEFGHVIYTPACITLTDNQRCSLRVLEQTFALGCNWKVIGHINKSPKLIKAVRYNALFASK